MKLLCALPFILASSLALFCSSVARAEDLTEVARIATKDGPSAIRFYCELRNTSNFVHGESIPVRSCKSYRFDLLVIESANGGRWELRTSAYRFSDDQKVDEELRIRLSADWGMIATDPNRWLIHGPIDQISNDIIVKYFPVTAFTPLTYEMDSATVEAFIAAFVHATPAGVLDTIREPGEEKTPTSPPLLMVLGSGIRDKASSAELKIGCIKSFDDMNTPCKKIIAVEDLGDGIERPLGEAIEPTELSVPSILDAFARSISARSVQQSAEISRAFVLGGKKISFSPPALAFPAKFDTGSLINEKLLTALQRKDVTAWQFKPRSVSTNEYRSIRAVFSGGTGNALKKNGTCAVSAISYLTDGYNTFEENQNSGLFLKNANISLTELDTATSQSGLTPIQQSGIKRTFRQNVEKLLLQSRIGSYVDFDPKIKNAPELIFMSADPVLCGTVHIENGLRISSSPYHPCGAHFRLILRKHTAGPTVINKTGFFEHPDGTVEQPELSFWVHDSHPKERRKMWGKIAKWLQTEVGCE